MGDSLPWTAGYDTIIQSTEGRGSGPYAKNYEIGEIIMKNLKKLLAGALAGLMALSLAGCGGAMSLEEQIANARKT